MSYIGIGATDPNHPLEVEGQVFISNVEQGSTTNLVPFEVYSDYDGVADNAILEGARQLRLRVTPSATTTSNVNIDMGIESKGGDYFYISNPVVDTELGSNTAFRIVQAGHVEVGSNLSVTGNVVASNIVGGSPLTISTGSNVQILTSNVGIGTVVDPLSNTRVHIQGGSTASITNSNAFPNFIFSRSVDSSNNHVGGGHNTARHALFPDDTGKVWAVGYGDAGALGLGVETGTSAFVQVSALDGVANIVASSTTNYSLSAVYGDTILLDDTGNVWVCGNNNEGALGLGDTQERFTPTLVTTNIYNVSITEVSFGGTAALVLDSTGQMWGAGQNSDYRLGELSGSALTTQTTFIPTYPGAQGEYTFTSIDCGEAFSLALQDNGRIWSTGAGSYGRNAQGGVDRSGWTVCPDGTTTNPALSEVSITQISTGEYHSMARDSTGNVWMTGRNNRGQLGLGDTTNRNYFERVTSNINVNQGVSIKKVGAAYQTSFALDTNGKMWGAGWSSAGAFGNPPYLETLTSFVRADAGPIADKSITDFAITSFMSTIVRTSDNEYWVTGYNNFGNLGTGDYVNRYVYTKLLDVNANPPPDYGYTRSLLLENTETGKGPSIELKSSDAVSSRIQMEDGTSGKLNIGFVDASYDPKLSGGDGAYLPPFQERAQSNTMTRGVTINQAGGTMVAGGSTSNIGLNTPIFNSGRPGSGNYGYDMGCGDQYASAFVSTEGRIYIAGNNDNGAYGDATSVSSGVFIDVTPPSTYPIVAVVDGNQFTYAIDSQGNTWKTGLNQFGALGLGDVATRYTWVDNGDDVYGVAVGGAFTLLNGGAGGGSLYVTGSNGEGQLGLGATASITSFQQITTDAMSGRSVRSVWASVFSSFVICTDNTLIASGRNSGGLLGTNTTPGVDVKAFTVCPNTNFSGKVPVQVSSTYEHSLMLTSDGQVYATGSGSYYRTGLNSTSDVQVFTRCTGAIQSYTITRVAVRTTGSFALDSTGNVWSCGQGNYNGLISTADTQEFTKITVPEEFYSRTIVNIKPGHGNTVYAVDSEGVLWGMGVAIRGTGGTGASDKSSSIFTKIPLTNMPSAFKYTPTLTLENPNPDYGATVEFKNPNNRAFINLDDKTSNLRLGFVNNEDNAGQFKGISISPSDNSVYFNQGLNLDAPGDEGINFRVPSVAVVDTYDAISKFIGIRDSSGAKMAGIDFTGENDGQKISFYTHDSGVSIGTRMTIYQNGIMQCLNPNARFVNGDATSAVSYGWYTRWNARVPGLGRFEIINQRGGGPGGIEFGNHQTGGFTTFGDWCPLYAASFNVVSDFRLKRDIQTIENGLDTISRLNPTTFETNMSNEGDDYVRKSGFIAQEVYYDTPELRHALTMPHDAQSDIETNRLPNYENWGNDRASMELAPIIPYLVKAVQELKARVEALENA